MKYKYDKNKHSMNPNISSSLIHFTNNLEYLKGILENGFRYSYCSEEYTKALVNNIKNMGNDHFTPNNICTGNNVSPIVLIPMVSFCDIPLTRVEVHAEKYGQYGVGIDRELARQIYCGLMPVQYMSDERYKIALSELSMILSNSHNFNSQIINSIKLVIATNKPYRIKRDGKERLCYEEREWRVIHSDNGDTLWGWGIDDKNTKQLYNKRLHANKDLSHLTFIKVEDEEGTRIVEEYLDKLITHILVRQETEIPLIAKFIMDENNTIFGYNLSSNSRLLLISRLISFERLSKDY